ncbi:MAG: hypothetical protein S0880_06030 [Actinomycetota bacterium]|nr:hypothetical protein [Actinomycetota bacterium]
MTTTTSTTVVTRNPDPPADRRRVRRALVAVAVVAVTATACGGDDEAERASEDTAASTTATAEPTTSTAAPRSSTDDVAAHADFTDALCEETLISVEEMGGTISAGTIGLITTSERHYFPDEVIAGLDPEVENREAAEVAAAWCADQWPALRSELAGDESGDT